jgi:DnaA family protein
LNSVVNEQLTLRFGWGDVYSFANYVVAGNAAAVRTVQELAGGQGERFVYLWGAPGSGKSHLLQAACQAAAERGATAAYLPLQELAAFGTGILEGLEQLALVCLDDLHCVIGPDVVGREEWESALFDLYNRMREQDAALLVAAEHPPAALAPRLPDLSSRLGWGPVFQLLELDEAGKIAALRARAAGRGFELPVEVAEFLLKRQRRDTVSLFALLDRLDQASLAHQRKLTIPFVRTLI